MIQCKTVNTPYTVSVGRGRIDFPWLCGLIKCHQLGVFTHVLEYGVYYRVASSTPDIKGRETGFTYNGLEQSSSILYSGRILPATNRHWKEDFFSIFGHHLGVDWGTPHNPAWQTLYLIQDQLCRPSTVNPGSWFQIVTELKSDEHIQKNTKNNCLLIARYSHKGYVT